MKSKSKPKVIHHAKEVDILFSKHVVDEYDIEITGDPKDPKASERKAKDVREIIKLYKEYTLRHF